MVVPMAENTPPTNEPIPDSTSWIFVPMAENTVPTQEATVFHRPINQEANAAHTAPNQAVIWPQCWMARIIPVTAAMTTTAMRMNGHVAAMTPAAATQAAAAML